MNDTVQDQTPSLGDRIRKTLIERIATGHYKSGERLIEMRLAEEFGTSQMPIREALRDLEMAGLVTARPRRGSFVKPFATSAQREIYLVRGALEEAAARLATMNPALDIAALQGEVDGM
ncbi:MAG TPA: GntR family transcriptional regulator, partial [Nordella sp.]|nr:GntR family transcriptional regulator [Nordella sp.]